jgi:thioesterase domain-containing protein
MGEDIYQTRWESRNLQLLRSYVPSPYSGKIVLFKATERDLFSNKILGSDLGWKSLAIGDFQIFDIPGDHIGILQEPNVRLLAQHLEQFLMSSDKLEYEQLLAVSVVN